MNDFGADKNSVLIISLDGKEYLTDEKDYVLVFDTFRQIKDYAKENGYQYDEFYIHEVEVMPDEEDIIFG